MLRILMAAGMVAAVSPTLAVSAVPDKPDSIRVFQTALHDARTTPVADSWPLLVISRAEAFHQGWSIAAFAPVRGKPGAWSVSFTRSNSEQAPVTHLLSSAACPAITQALSSLSEVDTPHIFLPGFPSNSEDTGPLVFDGPSLELWSPAGRYFGQAASEGTVSVVISGNAYSRFGRAATTALENLAKCS